MARFAFLDHPGPVAFAHRGGSAERPENTRASFSHARDLGYRYLETDVRLTADGVVVVIHDPTLHRVGERPDVVDEVTWDQLATMPLVGGEHVPRLDELLADFPDTRWNIDAKCDAVVEPLAAVIRRAGAIDRVCVTSFSDRRLRRVRGLLGPQLCTAMGPVEVTALRLGSLALGLPGLPAHLPAVPGLPRPGAAQVPRRQGSIPVVDRWLIAAAHRLGVAVHVWTVDDERSMDELLDLGVDGLMTDRPTLLRDVLRRRGEWTEA